jgi:hypothetical protein
MRDADDLGDKVSRFRRGREWGRHSSNCGITVDPSSGCTKCAGRSNGVEPMTWNSRVLIIVGWCRRFDLGECFAPANER